MYRKSLVSQQRKRQKFKVSNLVLGLFKHQEIQHFMNNKEAENQPDHVRFCRVEVPSLFYSRTIES